jgi:hypothetical protein
MNVEIEGLRELSANLQATSAKIQQATMKGMQAVGLEIIAEAKMNLKRNRTTNTGVLSASGKVQKVEGGEDEGMSIDAGFFASDSKEGYAAAVEYGRGPSRRRGPIPLEDSLKAWVHRKLGVGYGKELDQAAFLIARKIHRKGTKPQPFFAPAVEVVQERMDDIINKYIEEATNEK